jgi:hypothetical protein
VTVRVSDDLRLKADGVVIFPQSFEGNTVLLILFSNGSRTVSTLILNSSTTTELAAIPSEELTIFVSFQRVCVPATNIFYLIKDW